MIPNPIDLTPEQRLAQIVSILAQGALRQSSPRLATTRSFPKKFRNSCPVDLSFPRTRAAARPVRLRPGYGHLVRGAFDASEWTFAPRAHVSGEVFVVGRVARPDPDKWPSNTWPIYERI